MGKVQWVDIILYMSKRDGVLAGYVIEMIIFFFLISKQSSLGVVLKI